jgi:hypothetical protein
MRISTLIIIYSKNLWEELIAYFPLIRLEEQRTTRQQFFVPTGMALPRNHHATIEVYILVHIYKERERGPQKHAYNNSPLKKQLREL